MDRAFIKRLFFFSLGGILLVAAFNFLIDPFNIHSLTLVPGMNHMKQESAHRLIASLGIRAHKPKTLVLGTSRVRCFTEENLKDVIQAEAPYNAFFPGASFDEMYAYFEYASRTQPDLKQVILGIDLLSFHEKRKPQADFSEERLEEGGFVLKDVKDCLLSYKALSASCKVLYKSIAGKDWGNHILDLGEYEYLKSMLNSEENYKDYRVDPVKVEKFRKMAAICQEQDIDLKVFICPVKAMYWEFYFQNGLWPHLEDLKRQLCAIYPVWDFSGYNLITTEALDSDGNAMYLECSHFTSYVSRLLLKRMYRQPSPIDAVGYLLTPETIEPSLAAILDERETWLQKQ